MAEISTKWWSSVCPSGVDGKKALEKALTKAEKALNQQSKKSEDPKAVDNCLTALKTLPSTISKTTKECDKKTHKSEIKELGELKKKVEAEVERLEQLKKDLAAGNKDDEPHTNRSTAPAAY